MGAGIVFKAKSKTAAEILIYEDVGEGWFGGISAKAFAEQLKALGSVDTIDVRINSYGGDVFDGLAIYNQLVQHRATITTHIDGVAASIASVIAMAGKDIRIAESGWLMIHDAWGMGVGNAAVMRDLADRLDAVSNQLAGVYAARSGRPVDEIRGWMAEERWFSAADALDSGLATSMAENLRMAASGAPARFGFRHVPAALAGTPAARPDAAVCSVSGPDAEAGTMRRIVQAQSERFARRRALDTFKSRGAG